MRIVRNERLSEFKAEVAVSQRLVAEVELVLSLTAFPSLQFVAGAPLNLSRIVATMQPNNLQNVTATWRILGQSDVRSGANATFDLPPGDYVLSFTTVRDLNAHVYGSQRFLPDALLPVSGLRIASNRVFDEQGNVINPNPPSAPLNALANHLFGATPILPLDTWTIQLKREDNPILTTITVRDEIEIDLSEMDVILALEYETRAV